MEIIIASVIAVLGWGVTHYLTLRAQRKAFINQIKNDARLYITSKLKDFYLIITSLFEEDAYLHELIITKEFRIRPKNLFDYTARFRKLVTSIDSEPDFIMALKEYETLFPETRNAREILGKKNYELKIHLDKIVKELSSPQIDHSKFINTIKEIDGSAIAAQEWLIRDILIIIQNITIGEITGNKVEPLGITGPVPVRHPRFILNKKGKIVYKKHKSPLYERLARGKLQHDKVSSSKSN